MSLVDEMVEIILLEHLRVEEKILSKLLFLEKEFRNHFTLMKLELQSQTELIDRMWLLSQRYILLESTGPMCRFADVYTAPTEDNLLQEFNDKLKQIYYSNRRVYISLSELRKPCLTLKELCKDINPLVKTPLTRGDTFHKPITYFTELISDLFKYFHAWLQRLRYTSHMIDPYQLDSIGEYKNLLTISEEFEEYLDVGLTYCKCLRPKPTCPDSTCYCSN